MTALTPQQQDSRYAAVRQYSLAQILTVWAAAAVPMAVLAWVIAPLLGALLGGETAFIKALLLCLTAGLVWQFVLTLILVRREQGTLRFSRVRNALWLLSPRDPRSGRVGGRARGWGSSSTQVRASSSSLPYYPSCLANLCTPRKAPASFADILPRWVINPSAWKGNSRKSTTLHSPA